MTEADRDLVNIATGKSQVDAMIDSKKVRERKLTQIVIRGDIEKLEKISEILHHERSKLYRSVVTEPVKKEASDSQLGEDSLHHSISDVAHARL